MRTLTLLWKSSFQLRFIVNLWSGDLDDQLIGPFVFEGRVTGEACLLILYKELPRLLEAVLWN